MIMFKIAMLGYDLVNCHYDNWYSEGIRVRTTYQAWDDTDNPNPLPIYASDMLSSRSFLVLAAIRLLKHFRPQTGYIFLLSDQPTPARSHGSLRSTRILASGARKLVNIASR